MSGDWLKGSPILMGGPLESKPTCLMPWKIQGCSSTSAFFLVSGIW